MLIDLSVIGRLARVQRRALTGVGADQQHVERVLLLNHRKLHGVGNLPRAGQRAMPKHTAMNAAANTATPAKARAAMRVDLRLSSSLIP